MKNIKIQLVELASLKRSTQKITAPSSCPVQKLSAKSAALAAHNQVREQARDAALDLTATSSPFPDLPMHTPSRPLAYLCLSLSMSLMGSYVALSTPWAAIFPVMLLAWLRFGIGGIAMLAWLRPPPMKPL